MSIPVKTEYKQCAKRLAKVLKEEFGIEVSHTRALQVMSKVYGYKNWNTVSAVLSDEKPESGSVGEVARFLFNYERSEPVVFAEWFGKMGVAYNLYADIECGAIPYHEDRPILSLAEEGELVGDVVMANAELEERFSENLS